MGGGRPAERGRALSPPPLRRPPPVDPAGRHARGRRRHINYAGWRAGPGRAGQTANFGRAATAEDRSRRRGGLR